MKATEDVYFVHYDTPYSWITLAFRKVSSAMSFVSTLEGKKYVVYKGTPLVWSEYEESDGEDRPKTAGSGDDI